jgi:putative transposase
MAWKETCVADEKLRFIAAYLAGDEPMTALCASFGVSRDTGYRLVRRYEAEGIAGLAPHSRAPHRRPQAMAQAVVEAILDLRRARPHWGPKKLLAVLQRENSATCWPVASTIGDLLRREGLSAPRRRRRAAMPTSQPFQPVLAPNDLWCIDFKGWFRTGDGRRCDPLTLTDAYSRLLIECRIVPPTGEGVSPVVERALRELGLPRAIRSDNGHPFASTGAAGLTRLSLHWVKLGIRLERIEPGAPQQNGRHERMHGTLKAETAHPPAATLEAQQECFDRFRRDFNQNRPHEALNQDTPERHYHPSPRPYPSKIEEPCYPADLAVRRVRANGEIKWAGEHIFISQVLQGEPVALAETEAGDWRVCFANIELGIIDRTTMKLRRVTAGRSPRRDAKPEQTEETVRHVSGP